MAAQPIAPLATEDVILPQFELLAISANTNNYASPERERSEPSAEDAGIHFEEEGDGDQ